jgi:hypothetical protein
MSDFNEYKYSKENESISEYVKYITLRLAQSLNMNDYFVLSQTHKLKSDEESIKIASDEFVNDPFYSAFYSTLINLVCLYENPSRISGQVDIEMEYVVSTFEMFAEKFMIDIPSLLDVLFSSKQIFKFYCFKVKLFYHSNQQLFKAIGFRPSNVPSTNVDLYVHELFRLQTLGTLKSFFHRFVDPETIIAQLWYAKYANQTQHFTEQQLLSVLNDTPRKLDWKDFANEIYKRLPISILVNLLQSDYIHHHEQRITRYLLHAIMKQQKLYLVDIPYYSTEEKQVVLNHSPYLKDDFEHNVISLNSSLNLQMVGLVDELSKYKAMITNRDYFDKEIHTLAELISDELEVIRVIVTLNLAWKLYQIQRIDFFEFERQVFELKKFTKTFKYHQACLWQQIVSVMFNEHIRLSFSNEFRDVILNFYSLPSHQSCAAYISSNNKVLCDHLTFHFYTFFKYLKLFEYIQAQFQESSTPSDIIHPKDLFCNRCYDHYKEFTNIPSFINQQTKPLNIIPHKYVIFKYKNRLNFLRTRFTDQCDIKLSTMKNHQKEWISTKDAALKAQASLIESIGMEIHLLNEQLIKEYKASQQAQKAF